MLLWKIMKNHLHGTWKDISTRNSPEDPSKPSSMKIWLLFGNWRYSGRWGIYIYIHIKSNRFAWRFSHPEAIIGDIPIPLVFDRTSLKKRFWTHRKQKASHQIQSSPLLQYTFELRSLSSSISWQSRRIFTAAFRHVSKTVKCWGGHPARCKAGVWQTLG